MPRAGAPGSCSLQGELKAWAMPAQELCACLAGPGHTPKVRGRPHSGCAGLSGPSGPSLHLLQPRAPQFREEEVTRKHTQPESRQEPGIRSLDRKVILLQTLVGKPELAGAPHIRGEQQWGGSRGYPEQQLELRRP